MSEARRHLGITMAEFEMHHKHAVERIENSLRGENGPSQPQIDDFFRDAEILYIKARQAMDENVEGDDARRLFFGLQDLDNIAARISDNPRQLHPNPDGVKDYLWDSFDHDIKIPRPEVRSEEKQNAFSAPVEGNENKKTARLMETFNCEYKIVRRNYDNLAQAKRNKQRSGEGPGTMDILQQKNILKGQTDKLFSTAEKAMQEGLTAQQAQNLLFALEDIDQSALDMGVRLDALYTHRKRGMYEDLSERSEFLKHLDL